MAWKLGHQRTRTQRDGRAGDVQITIIKSDSRRGLPGLCSPPQGEGGGDVSGASVYCTPGVRVIVLLQAAVLFSVTEDRLGPETMRVACAIACLLAAPEVAAFHVAVPTARQRGSFSPAVARKSVPGVQAPRFATTARMLSGGAQEEKAARARRFSAMVSASSVAVENSVAVRKIESLRGGGAGGEVAEPKPKSKMFRAYETGARWFTNLFPIWLCVFSGVALKDPSVFAWFTTE